MPIQPVVSVVSLRVTRAIHFGKRMELLKDPFLKKSIQKHLYAYSKKWKKLHVFTSFTSSQSSHSEKIVDIVATLRTAQWNWRRVQTDQGLQPKRRSGWTSSDNERSERTKVQEILEAKNSETKSKCLKIKMMFFKALQSGNAKWLIKPQSGTMMRIKVGKLTKLGRISSNFIQIHQRFETVKK